MSKTITITISENKQATVNTAGCEGQDLYEALCVYIAHMNKYLVNPNSLEDIVRVALKDAKKMIVTEVAAFPMNPPEEPEMGNMPS